MFFFFCFMHIAKMLLHAGMPQAYKDLLAKTELLSNLFLFSVSEPSIYKTYLPFQFTFTAK